MPERSLSRITMRFGASLGIAAAALIVLGPFIIGNFGVGSSWAATSPLPADAPVGVAVSTVYSLIVQFSVPFSAALVGAALVMRHNEGEGDRKASGHGQTKTGPDPELPGS